MSTTAFNLEGSGFRSVAELDAWFEFLEWERNTDADPGLYEYQAGRGWFRVVRASVAALLPFIAALADLLVTDLLRVHPGKG